MSTITKFKHVEYLWDDEVADGLSPVERLRYRSNCLGADQRITNTGGGNTSSKAVEIDPLTGEEVDVLWVKGSGGDLRTATHANFASMYMDKFLGLVEKYKTMPDTGLKSTAEDSMVGYFSHCTFNLNPRAGSIDTPLHGFLPEKHIDHMHPTSVIAIAACDRCDELTREIYGETLGIVPWMRPGVELALKMRQEIDANPGCQGLIMAQHGLIIGRPTIKTVTS